MRIMHEITKDANECKKYVQYSLNISSSRHYVRCAKDFICNYKHSIKQDKEDFILNAFKIQQNNTHCKDL